MNWKGSKDKTVKGSLFSRIFRPNIAVALFFLALITIITLIAMPNVSASSLRTGLVGEWRFDGGFGTTAYDGKYRKNYILNRLY